MAKHKHYDLIVWWASDPENNIVQHFSSTGYWENCADNKPWWEPTVEYRKKPKIVKRWKWAYAQTDCGYVYETITNDIYTEKEFIDLGMIVNWYFKIEPTLVEFTE